MQVVVAVTGVLLAWGLAAAQWWRARTNAAGVSSLSWAVFLATNLAWLVYALGTRNPYLLANTIGSAALNAALLWRIDQHRWRTYAAVVAGALACGALFVAAGQAPVAVVCFSLAFIVRWPQLVHAVRAPDVTGVSLVSWSLALANNSVWVAVGLMRGDAWFAAANMALGASTVVLLAVVLVRRRTTHPDLVAPADA